MGITTWLLEFALKLIDSIGYFGLAFILIIDNAGVPIPSEATLALAGSLARIGRFNLVLLIIIGAVAQTLGTYIAYLIGKYGGGPLVKKYGKFLLISAHDYEKAEAWFDKRGQGAILLSRITPVIRTFAGFAAGTFEMDQFKFLRDSFIGSLVWTILFVMIGYALGDSWRHYYNYLHYVDYIVLAALLVLLVRYIFKKTRKPAHEADKKPPK